MRGRILQLKKYFGDPTISKESDGSVKSLGEYRSFGFYDAIDYSEEFDLDYLDKRNQWHIASRTSICQLNGNNHTRNLICFTDDRAADDLFWKRAKLSPVLFVTLARINEEWDDENNNYLKVIHEQQSNYLENQSIIYFTSTHSELVVVTYGNCYSECKDRVVNLLSRYGCLKLYSIFSVAETEIEAPNHIVDEYVKSRLKVSVKEPRKINDFVSKLKNRIEMGIEAEWAVGKSDIIIDIPNISIRKLLTLYKAGDILTHTGYQPFFYDIETHLYISDDLHANTEK